MQAKNRPLFFLRQHQFFENSCLGPLNWNIHHCAYVEYYDITILTLPRILLEFSRCSLC